MAQPKTYDSTLARIAGNIAGAISTEIGGHRTEHIAKASVDIAVAIIELCEARQRAIGDAQKPPTPTPETPMRLSGAMVQYAQQHASRISNLSPEQYFDNVATYLREAIGQS